MIAQRPEPVVYGRMRNRSPVNTLCTAVYTVVRPCTAARTRQKDTHRGCTLRAQALAPAACLASRHPASKSFRGVSASTINRRPRLGSSNKRSPSGLAVHCRRFTAGFPAAPPAAARLAIGEFCHFDDTGC